MFLVIKSNLPKIISYLVIFTILFSANAFISQSNKINASISPGNRFTVVLDAGHGGIDKGCYGVNTNANERDINLSIAQKTGSFLNNLGVYVIYTRSNDEGLYGVFASGFKRRDMKERERIIKNAQPNLVVSIHLNSFPDHTARGAQVFYAINSDTSKELGQLMQDLFVQTIPESRKNCTAGDFYILNCTSFPSILIECGFLSNPEEEANLIQPSYQELIAYTIVCGIVGYFGLEN